MPRLTPTNPGVSAGTDYTIFEHSGVRYGINICNDANHSDAAQSVADQGASLILYLLNNLLPPDTAAKWRAKSVENLRARARQTGCWIVSADVTGEQGELVSHGCTVVVNPGGQIVARAKEGAEGMAVFDIPPMVA
jgi:predicted amidohydrolase